eukprot:2403642-Amphidinium_carterae.1
MESSPQELPYAAFPAMYSNDVQTSLLSSALLLPASSTFLLRRFGPGSVLGSPSVPWPYFLDAPVTFGMCCFK